MLLGAIIYVGVYTLWLKPRTLLNIVIGGAAGSAAVLSGSAAVGAWNDPGAVVFRINEGPKERISAIHIVGNTIVSEARLKKVISSRGPAGGIISYVGNPADLNKINQDVDVLASYYHNLGFLTATVGRRITRRRAAAWRRWRSSRPTSFRW